MSFLDRNKPVVRKIVRAKGRKGATTKSAWTDQKRIEVVTSYMALGSPALVEAVTGVPRATISSWKQEVWWKDLVHEIQGEEDVKLDRRLEKIVDRSLDAVVDRIENGDFDIDRKTGEIRRIPTKLKDLHRVSVDLIDKRALLRSRQSTKRNEAVEGDRLLKLAEQFAQFARALKDTPEKQTEKTIEGEVIE
jgi:hypothetical protein